MSRPSCLHCRTPVPEGSGTEPFCCAGCAAVHELLASSGLDRFYELAGDRVEAAPLGGRAAESHAWLEPLLTADEAGACDLRTLRLDVQGIHCSACVWLIEQVTRRDPGTAGVSVDPTLGRLELRYDPERFDPLDWIRRIESFGYRFGPPRKAPRRGDRQLLLRLGVSAALAVNLMLFSVSFYFGLTPEDPEIFRLFTRLSLALATGVVVIGGWPFLAGSWQALRRGVLHLDLPIAAGILLVYGSSLATLGDGRGDRAYFDTLAIFITLMLLGRVLQERLLERNRRYLLEDDGADRLVVRRLEGGRPVVRGAGEVRIGDRLLVAPGDLVPVDAALDDGAATVRTDWVTGESDPRSLGRGEPVPAGAVNCGRSAFTAVATVDFAGSSLVALLRRPARPFAGGPHARLWDRLARFWVAGVALAALAGLLLWWPGDPERAVAVAAAILVVTCPCAIGIAVPLAYELVLGRLRREGCFVRAGDLLDRILRVRRVVFDKTGTLTLGRLELDRPEALADLDPLARGVAYNLAARSTHPASLAIAEALGGFDPPFDPAAAVEETPGRGLAWERPDGTWRLGAAAWAAPGASGKHPVLSRDGRALATIELRERLRPEARRQIAELAASGRELWLLSGDSPARAEALGRALGFDPGRIAGGLAPAEKAARVAALDRDDTLYLGDGVNDAPAFAAAYAAGTPALDRPVMPGRSDFFLVGEGIGALGRLFDDARRLRRVVRRLLAVAVVYNAAAVGAALAGWITPLVAAVVMPASTLTLVALTVAGLEGRRRSATTRARGRLVEATP